MKKPFYLYLFLILLPLAVVLTIPFKTEAVAVSLVPTEIISVAAQEKPDDFEFVRVAVRHSALVVTAIDAASGTTVTNAHVRIVENGAHAQAVDGVSTLVAPYLPDPRYSVTPPFGTCTLIVTAPDYIPTVLNGCVVFTIPRNVTVSLFKQDGSISDPVVSLSETPPMDWLAAL